MSDVSRVCENLRLLMFSDPLPPSLPPLKWTLVGAEHREMGCSGVPSILGLGSYLEFLQMFVESILDWEAGSLVSGLTL